jgi:hypothetical protein
MKQITYFKEGITELYAIPLLLAIERTFCIESPFKESPSRKLKCKS